MRNANNNPTKTNSRQRSFSTETDNDNAAARKNGNQDWKQRILERLRDLFGETSSNNDEGSSSSESKKLTTVQVGAVATLVAFSVIGFYRYRRGMKSRKNMILWPVLLAMFRRPDYHAAVEVSLSLLRSLAKNGQITRALVGPSKIVFQDVRGGGWKRSTLPKNNPTLQSELMDLLCNGGCAEVSALPETLWSRLGPPLLTALPFVYLGLMYKILKNLNGGDMSNKLLDGKRQQHTKFSDVAGLDSIMPDVTEVVSYLKEPTLYHRLGAKPPRGILFHGPPGSGKTLLAQAIAGEADCDAFIACCGSDFCEMYVGRGASRVRSIFDKARSTALKRYNSWLPWKAPIATNRPATAIIFIDELDALAKSRSYDAMTSSDERDQTLNQLLTEMDGFQSQGDGVIIIVIGATNRADILDPAVIRRFDRRIRIPYPDKTGRRDILKIHARKTACFLEDIDWEALASDELTGNFSGSDLRNLVNDATLLAVRERSPNVLQSHYNHAVRRVRAMKDTSRSSSQTSQGRIWLATNGI